jgi:hypothetical protein
MGKKIKEKLYLKSRKCPKCDTSGVTTEHKNKQAPFLWSVTRPPKMRMLRRCLNCEYAWWELTLDHDQKAEDKADAEFAIAQAKCDALERQKKAEATQASPFHCEGCKCPKKGKTLVGKRWWV